MIGTIRAKRLLIHTGQRIRDPTNVFGISVADTMDHWVRFAYYILYPKELFYWEREILLR